MRYAVCYAFIFLGVVYTTACAAVDKPMTYRLYEGISLYVNNAAGEDFDVQLDVRDLNIYANGPREVMVKIYDPDGKPIVRQFIPDDGVVANDFPGRLGGWDHELAYAANLMAKGTLPTTRFSAWSDPKRLATLRARSFQFPVKAKGSGVYRVVIAGTTDHYVTVNITPGLPTAVGGHPSFLHAHHNMFQKRYVYVPRGTSGLFLILIEPDPPRSRTFKLTSPDGQVLFEGQAQGGYVHPDGKEWNTVSANVSKYAGQLLTFEASDGPGDFMVNLVLTQPKKGAFKDYVGMGSNALFAPDPETAMALRGGTTVVDDQLFWHPFQIRFHNWLAKHSFTEDQKQLQELITKVFNGFRLLETSDGRGSASWTNWAYAFGYYGCKIWRDSWDLMRRDDVPSDLKAIIREGLIVAGDRLSMAAGMERVNGNAFSQIAVQLWYAAQATGDPILQQRFELFWGRWANNEGWGRGVGLSRSGDSQEHFSHDMHYGSYLMDNWLGKQWVKSSIIEDAKGVDDRFQHVLDRYRNLYSYLYCRDADGRAVPANPWSSRTHASAHAGAQMWEPFGHPWKGDPGPDFTLSVNDGDEWFAARRKNYYALTFHGRLAPEWLSRTFAGELGFGGGTLCQLTIPGHGPVLTGTLHGSYGKDMDVSQWRRFHIHSLVGERWDGQPIVAAVSEHEGNAVLTGNTVTSSGEVRDAHVRVTRSYTFEQDRIRCSVALAESEYANVLSIWSGGRQWSDVRLAYEMIPFRIKRLKNGKFEPLCTVTLYDASDNSLGEATAEALNASRIRIDHGGFGVDVILPEPMPVQLGEFGTVMIQITDNLVKAEAVKLSYDLVPFVAK